MAMASPNMGTYAMTSAGGNMIQQALGMKESANAKRAKLSQEEQLVMFNMVRNTCDKLVASYRDYKKNSVSLARASLDLQDLKSMVSDARNGQDAAKQLEMEYTLRKQQRDIDTIAEEVRRHRQSLVDLAGGEAATKLDKQLAEERNQIQQSTFVADQTKQDAASQTESEQSEKTAATAPEDNRIVQPSISVPEEKQTASSQASPQS
jgi:hypothetical protein